MNDAAYKRLLNHQRFIKDLILGYIAPLRPAGWADTLDFDSLREHPTEYVGDDLSHRFSDAVWSIDRRAADGSARTTYVLIEHQSTVDYSMALRFLNYGSLQYQRRYRDHQWRKGDTADPVLHVVLYNGGTRWDAPRSLAELVRTNPEHDGPAQLALSYDVVDLVGMAAEELPRPNLISWVADIERSRRAGMLAERVRELGQWLAGERRAGFDEEFRPVAGSPGAEVGRGVAVDTGLRGGKRNVVGEDRSLGS